MEELTRVQHKAAEALYRQSQGGPAGGSGAGPEPAGGQTGSAPPKDEVIDAEVVDDK